MSEVSAIVRFGPQNQSRTLLQNYAAASPKTLSLYLIWGGTGQHIFSIHTCSSMFWLLTGHV